MDLESLLFETPKNDINNDKKPDKTRKFLIYGLIFSLLCILLLIGLLIYKIKYYE